LSQVTEFAEKENQLLIADQIIAMELELSLCLILSCSHLPNINHFRLLWLSVFMLQLEGGEWI